MTRQALWALGVVAILGVARASSPLEGTWTGKLTAGNESVPATAKFNAAGRPMYDYAAKAGARSVELTRKGQSWRYVPPGGGVTTITVLDYAVTRDGVRYQLRISTERTRGAIRTHEIVTSAVDAKLVEGQLAVEIKVTVQSSVFGSQTGFTGGTSMTSVGKPRSATLKGTLKKK